MKLYVKGGIALSALLGLPILLSGQASAAACSISDINLTIASTTYNPSSCAEGISQTGGPTAETTNLNTAFGTSFTFVAKDDGTSDTLDGIKFAITADDGSTSGHWTVSWQDTNGATSLNLPITIDFIVGLFGGDNGDGYEFQDVLLPTSPTSGTGSFEVVFLNNGGQVPGLSHVDLLAGDPEEVSTPVPEPATLALVGSALVGFGFLRRRRKS